MGNSCNTDFPYPDTTNVCSPDPIGSSNNDHKIPHFCTLSVGGNSEREEYCGKLGDNEWEVKSKGNVGSCNYNDCNKVQAYDGHCGNCYAISGATVTCKRTAYNGNPTTCCLQDYDFPEDLQGTQQQLPLCFDQGTNGMDNSMQNTCDPEYRNITSTACQNNLLDYCVGADLEPNDTSWLNRWQDNVNRGNCSYAISRNLYVEPLPLFDNIVQWPPSAFRDNQGFAWSRELMERVFEKYQAQGFRIGTLPGLPGYNLFQDTILKPICTTAPGICQQGLNTICSNTTTDELLRNQALVPWCGCYMPNDQYQTYVDLYQASKECTPTCARQGNIPIVSADGRQTVLCNQSICIIDDVTITLENSNVGGSINFSQFCGGCSGPVSGVNNSLNTTSNNDPNNTGSQNTSSCLCIISDNTIDTASSSIGGGIDLNEDCGSNTQCFKQNPDPSNGLPDQLPINCNGPADQDPFTELMNQQEQERRDRIFRTTIIAVIVIIGIVVLMLVMLYLSRIGNDSSEKVIPREKAKIEQKDDRTLSSNKSSKISHSLNPSRESKHTTLHLANKAKDVGVYKPTSIKNRSSLESLSSINARTVSPNLTQLNKPMSIYDRGY